MLSLIKLHRTSDINKCVFVGLQTHDGDDNDNEWIYFIAMYT